MIPQNMGNFKKNTFVNFSFSDDIQPAEKECLVKIARRHVVPSSTAKVFASAYQTLMAAPAPAAGLGATAREVQYINSIRPTVLFCFVCCCFNKIGSQTKLSFCCQPAMMACMDQTASLAAHARMEAAAAVSVDASVLEGGEGSTVRSPVCIFRVTIILRVHFPCGSNMSILFVLLVLQWYLHLLSHQILNID